MNDKHNDHATPIKSPKQLALAIAAGFLVPIVLIVLLVQYVANDKKVGAGSSAQTPEAIAARIKPVGDEGFTLGEVIASRQLRAGADVYKAACAACHDTGAAGAPKLGDAGSWSARIAQGYDKVVVSATKGLRGMPAKGGNPDLDDVEVARAVVFLANQSGAKFKEPDGKAATPAAAAPVARTAATPAAAVASAATPATPAKLSADAGKKLYEAACQACHTPGIAGAPKLGDKAAWEPRIKQGKPVLYEHSIKGFQGKAGMMPAKGGSSAADEEVKAAVDYMVSAAK